MGYDVSEDEATKTSKLMRFFVLRGNYTKLVNL